MQAPLTLHSQLSHTSKCSFRSASNVLIFAPSSQKRSTDVGSKTWPRIENEAQPYSRVNKATWSGDCRRKHWRFQGKQTTALLISKRFVPHLGGSIYNLYPTFSLLYFPLSRWIVGLDLMEHNEMTRKRTWQDLGIPVSLVTLQSSIV